MTDPKLEALVEGLQFDCVRCEKRLIKPGALLFSTPDEYDRVVKRHVCAGCWPAVLAAIEPSPEPSENAEEVARELYSDLWAAESHWDDGHYEHGDHDIPVITKSLLAFRAAGVRERDTEFTSLRKRVQRLADGLMEGGVDTAFSGGIRSLLSPTPDPHTPGERLQVSIPGAMNRRQRVNAGWCRDCGAMGHTPHTDGCKWIGSVCEYQLQPTTKTPGEPKP